MMQEVGLKEHLIGDGKGYVLGMYRLNTSAIHIDVHQTRSFT